MKNKYREKARALLNFYQQMGRKYAPRDFKKSLAIFCQIGESADEVPAGSFELRFGFRPRDGFPPGVKEWRDKVELVWRLMRREERAFLKRLKVNLKTRRLYTKKQGFSYRRVLRVPFEALPARLLKKRRSLWPRGEAFGCLENLHSAVSSVFSENMRADIDNILKLAGLVKKRRDYLEREKPGDFYSSLKTYQGDVFKELFGDCSKRELHWEP